MNRISSLLCVSFFLPCVFAQIRPSRMRTGRRYRSRQPSGVERVWVGSDWYPMRLQDWRLARGRIECPEARPRRPIRILHQLRVFAGEGNGDFRLEVRTGPLEPVGPWVEHAAAGFWVGGGGKGVSARREVEEGMKKEAWWVGRGGSWGGDPWRFWPGATL